MYYCLFVSDSSYLHCEWATAEKLSKGDKRFDGKAKRYKAKLKAQGVFANVSLRLVLDRLINLYVSCFSHRLITSISILNLRK